MDRNQKLLRDIPAQSSPKQGRCTKPTLPRLPRETAEPISLVLGWPLCLWSPTSPVLSLPAPPLGGQTGLGPVEVHCCAQAPLIYQHHKSSKYPNTEASGISAVFYASQNQTPTMPSSFLNEGGQQASANSQLWSRQQPATLTGLSSNIESMSPFAEGRCC